MNDTVLTTFSGDGIARLTLNRPEAMNTFDLACASAFAAAAENCAARPDVRVILLSGTGKMFCAGGDLKHLASADGADTLAAIVTDLHRAVMAFARTPALVVVAANSAAGAGLSLVAGADYAIAPESARFTSAYTAAGLSPDGGLSWFLPRLIGLRRARTMMLLNNPVPAEIALQWRLIDAVVPEGQLARAAEETASRLAAGPRSAYAEVKRLTAGDFAAFEQHLAQEKRAIVGQLAGHEGREGLAAFLERRAPEFPGS